MAALPPLQPTLSSLAFERDASLVAEVEADSDFDGIRADAAFRALLAEGGGTTAEG